MLDQIELIRFKRALDFEVSWFRWDSFFEDPFFFLSSSFPIRILNENLKTRTFKKSVGIENL
jgi:hypothetical protein